MISSFVGAQKMIRLVIVVLLIPLTGCIPVKEFGKAWDQATIDPELEGHWKQMGQEYPINNAYQSFVRNGDAYDIDTPNASMPDMPAEMKKSMPPMRGRTLTIGRHKFLLMDAQEQNAAMAESMKQMNAEIAKQQQKMTSGTKKTEMKKTPDEQTPAGGIQRYAIVNGILTFYTLKENIVEAAVKRRSVKGFTFMIPGPDGAGKSTGLATLDEATQRFLARLADEPGNWQEVKFTRVKDLAADIEKSRTYPAGPQTGVNTTVRVNLPEYKYFCEGHRELFRRHLQASPEWCVFQEGQEIIVYRRQFKDEGWRMGDGSNGYVNNWEERIIDKASSDSMIRSFGRPVEKSEKYQIRYKFCFDLKAPSLEVWKPHTQTITPTAGDVSLELKSDEQGIESVLVIGHPGLWFEFMEQTNKEDRIKTREAIAWLETYSRDLQTAAQEIEENGYAASRMPEGAIRHGKPELTLTTPFLDSPWCVHIVAAVNPGQQGIVFLKAFDVGSNKPELKTRSGLDREYIGWSKHPETLFIFSTELNLPREAVKKGAKVRIELWFRPTDGAASPKWYDKTAPADVKMLDAIKDF